MEVSRAIHYSSRIEGAVRFCNTALNTESVLRCWNRTMLGLCWDYEGTKKNFEYQSSQTMADSVTV